MTFGTFWTYVIECDDGSLYTGSAADPGKRYEDHASGTSRAARYFRGRRPARILGKREYDSRAEAYRMELALKKMSPWEKRLWAHVEGGGPDPGPRPEGDRRPSPRRRRAKAKAGTPKPRKVRLKTILKNVEQEMAERLRAEREE